MVCVVCFNEEPKDLNTFKSSRVYDPQSQKRTICNMIIVLRGVIVVCSYSHSDKFLPAERLQGRHADRRRHLSPLNKDVGGQKVALESEDNLSKKRTLDVLRKKFNLPIEMEMIAAYK